jgi:hypothetical protein
MIIVQPLKPFNRDKCYRKFIKNKKVIEISYLSKKKFSV